MVTFNKANIYQDENGKTFLDLEIQGIMNGQKIIIKNTYPFTGDYFPEDLNTPGAGLLPNETEGQ